MLPNSDKVQVNFLLGPGRSGTTLLMLMLNEHPNILSTPELKHLLYFYERYKHIKIVTKELKSDLKIYFEELGKAGRFNGPFIFHLKELLESLKSGERINFGGIMKKAYLSFEYNKPASEVTAIVDKNPFYTLHWEKLVTVYPDAKFILTMRDPRGYVSSNYFSTDIFTRRKSIIYYALVWRFYAKKIKEILDRESKRSLFFSYEQFINDPSAVLSKIHTFLGLESLPNGAINYSKTVTEKLAGVNLNTLEPRLQKKLLDLEKPVYKEGLDNWKKKLSTSQIKACDFLCGAYGTRFGYAPLYRISFSDKLRIFASALLPWIRVWLAFKFRSVKLEHYFKVKSRIKTREGKA